MVWKGQSVRDWHDVAEWADMIAGTGKRYMFRGQPGDYGNLKPKYLRLLEQHGIDDAARAHAVEQDLLHTFFRTAPLHLEESPVRTLAGMPPLAAILQRWGIMQHYGAPTRVLDWTGAPFVALYFAVEKEAERPGEVWCYREKSLEVLWAAARTANELDRWPVEMPYPDYVDVRRIHGKPVLHHFIHGVQTSRMAAQQGVFTVCTDVFMDHAQLLQELLARSDDEEALQRVVVPAKQKMSFLHRLRLMNITGASLFPGIDGVGKSVEEWAHLKLSGQR